MTKKMGMLPPLRFSAKPLPKATTYCYDFRPSLFSVALHHSMNIISDTPSTPFQPPSVGWIPIQTGAFAWVSDGLLG